LIEWKIPFAKPQVPLNEDMVEEIVALISEGQVSNGEFCRQVEEEVQRISGADQAIVCSSCTQGLIIALAGSRVAAQSKNGQNTVGFTQSFTWDSTAIAINASGCPLYYLDIDYDNWMVKNYPAARGPAFALAVDTFGMQFNVEAQVPVFYDRAHSIGVHFRQLGLASVMSFSPSKLVTGGEGGVILTNRPKFAEAFIKARDMMSRMTEVSAVMILGGLRKLDDVLEWKLDTFNRYKKAFPDFQFQEGTGNHAVIGMLVDTNKQREQIMAYTEANGVELKAYYRPLHMGDPTYDWAGRLPVTEDVGNRIICLPSWYGVDRDAVVEAIRKAIE